MGVALYRRTEEPTVAGDELLEEDVNPQDYQSNNHGLLEEHTGRRASSSSGSSDQL
jgi:hypothetical protein